jgi:hypothetical protein
VCRLVKYLIYDFQVNVSRVLLRPVVSRHPPVNTEWISDTHTNNRPSVRPAFSQSRFKIHNTAKFQMKLNCLPVAYSAGIAIRHVEKYLGVISRKIEVPFSISFISHFAK